MNNNQPESKPLCGLFGNSFQLVLSHFMMSLVIYSLDFAAVLHWSYYAPEINNRARAYNVASRRHQRHMCHGNFTNDICHAFKLLVTMTDSASSSHKRRYKNEYESM